MEGASYKNMLFWKLGMELTKNIYKLTQRFPRAEQYGLVSQMRRAAVSIPANIAEGARRGSRKEYRVFLSYSFGSGAELETYLDLCLDLQYITSDEHKLLVNTLDQIMRMLNSAITKLTTTNY